MEIDQNTSTASADVDAQFSKIQMDTLQKQLRIKNAKIESMKRQLQSQSDQLVEYKVKYQSACEARDDCKFQVADLERKVRVVCDENSALKSKLKELSDNKESREESMDNLLKDYAEQVEMYTDKLKDEKERYDNLLFQFEAMKLVPRKPDQSVTGETRKGTINNTAELNTCSEILEDFLDKQKVLQIKFETEMKGTLVLAKSAIFVPEEGTSPVTCKDEKQTQVKAEDLHPDSSLKPRNQTHLKKPATEKKIEPVKSLKAGKSTKSLLPKKLLKRSKPTKDENTLSVSQQKTQVTENIGSTVKDTSSNQNTGGRILRSRWRV